MFVLLLVLLRVLDCVREEEGEKKAFKRGVGSKLIWAVPMFLILLPDGCINLLNKALMFCGLKKLGLGLFGVLGGNGLIGGCG